MAIALVAASANQDSNDNSATNTFIAYAQAVSKGNLLVCAVAWGHADLTPTVSDNVNNTSWTLATKFYASGAGEGVGIWYRYNTSAGTPTVTAYFGGTSCDYRKICVSEFSGAMNNTIPLDLVAAPGNATFTAGTDAVTTGAVSPLTDGELFFGAMMMVNASHDPLVAGTNFTNIVSAPGTTSQFNLQIESYIQASHASHIISYTNTDTDEYTIVGCTFKPATSPSLPSSWRRRQKIVIDHTKVAGDETLYQLLLVWTGSAATSNVDPDIVDLNNLYCARSDGGDIRVSSNIAGAQYPVDVVYISTNKEEF